MIATDAVTATVEVAVDPATAFEIFTGEIGAWWEEAQRGRGPDGRRVSIGRGPGHSGRLRFEPGPGGRLVEAYDDAAPDFEVGRVLVWKPADRLVFEWRQGNFHAGERTEVEVRFEPAARGTRVTLEHRGFAALPADHGTRHGLGTGEGFARMLAGFWGATLGGFRAVAEGTLRGSAAGPVRG